MGRDGSEVVHDARTRPGAALLRGCARARVPLFRFGVPPSPSHGYERNKGRNNGRNRSGTVPPVPQSWAGMSNLFRKCPSKPPSRPQDAFRQTGTGQKSATMPDVPYGPLPPSKSATTTNRALCAAH
jgi:hypothetical protein